MNIMVKHLLVVSFLISSVAYGAETPRSLDEIGDQNGALAYINRNEVNAPFIWKDKFTNGMDRFVSTKSVFDPRAPAIICMHLPYGARDNNIFLSTPAGSLKIHGLRAEIFSPDEMKFAFHIIMNNQLLARTIFHKKESGSQLMIIQDNTIGQFHLEKAVALYMLAAKMCSTTTPRPQIAIETAENPDPDISKYEIRTALEKLLEAAPLASVSLTTLG